MFQNADWRKIWRNANLEKKRFWAKNFLMYSKKVREAEKEVFSVKYLPKTLLL